MSETIPSPLQRRTYWYYQARLRWTGQTPPKITPDLLSAIGASNAMEEPEVALAYFTTVTSPFNTSTYTFPATI